VNPAADTFDIAPNGNSINKSSIIQHVNNDRPVLNFAKITAQENNLRREQAIVFNSIEDIAQLGYVLAVRQIVSQKNIRFVSRISNNRFCIFLASRSLVDSLVDVTKSITINDKEINLRRLINPAKRIVISNVCPSVPNQITRNALKNLNIVPTSPINYLKAEVNAIGYDYVLSFQRQMFLNPDDIPNLPGSLIISHEESQFRIFFTDARITCFTCKAIGHTAIACKKFNITNKSNTLESTNITNIINNATNENSVLVENHPLPKNLNIDAIISETVSDLSENIDIPNLNSPNTITVNKQVNPNNKLAKPQNQKCIRKSYTKM